MIDPLNLNFIMLQFLEIIIWPLCLIIIAITFMLLFRAPLLSFIERATKIGNDKFSINADQKLDKKQIETKNSSYIDSAYGMFKEGTMNWFRKVVAENSKYEGLDDDSKKIETLVRYSAVMSLVNNFEFIYYNIYGSQIALLREINKSTNSTKSSVEYIYIEAKKQYPDLYKEYSYDKYLNFLKGVNLILINNEKLVITDLGVDFLKYLLDAKKDENKHF